MERKKRILVVDDEAELLALLVDYLDRQGYEVWQAPSGGVAMMTITNGKRFDAVVTDVQMPKMTGWQLYVKAVQANTDLAERFIFATGNDYCEEAVPIKAAGNKPFDLAQLHGAILEVLNGQ